VKKNASITPDFFSVAPQLIGLPLAAPGRRAMAMAVDGFLVALLAQSGGVFLGLAAGFALLRASRPGERGGFFKRSVRFGLRAAAAVLIFVVVMQGARRVASFGENNDDEEEQETSAEVDGNGNLKLNFGPGDGLAIAGAVTGLSRAETPQQVRDNSHRILSAAKRAGASSKDLRDARGDLIELLGDDADSANVAALDSVIADVAGTEPAVLTQQDSLRTEIQKLTTRVERLDTRNDSLEARLKRARESRGVRTYLGGLFDDLGLGFGWAAVYFTAFIAMMNGQTPGKRLAGLRVIRLDGKPLGWWIAFERFGGYAASFSVGLLGFAQILWDRNRQGLHDKACETVVIREAAT
jgi:hypothetical protein